MNNVSSVLYVDGKDDAKTAFTYMKPCDVGYSRGILIAHDVLGDSFDKHGCHRSIDEKELSDLGLKMRDSMEGFYRNCKDPNDGLYLLGYGIGLSHALTAVIAGKDVSVSPNLGIDSLKSYARVKHLR